MDRALARIRPVVGLVREEERRSPVFFSFFCGCWFILSRDPEERQRTPLNVSVPCFVLLLPVVVACT
jgi:hypothetical protein